MLRFSEPQPLGAEHDTAGFECGVPSLNRWLAEHATGARAAGSARVFVVEDAQQGRIVGYYALAAASIGHDEATARARKGMPRHPIPAALLARLAVDFGHEAGGRAGQGDRGDGLAGETGHGPNR